MADVTIAQRAICRDHAADFAPPATGSRVGVALQTLGLMPLNGTRIAEHGNVCGWYLWGGEATSDDPDFYQPLCVEHVPDRCPLALSFLGLPPGWRFLTDGESVDVWFDRNLLESSRP